MMTRQGIRRDRMLVRDFIKAIGDDTDTTFWFGKEDHGTGYYVRNKRWDTVTHFTTEAIREHDMRALTAYMIQGKDVDHITRITGYFSKVSGWNEGKLGELRDRDRVTIT
jgi:hypothetical protein